MAQEAEAENMARAKVKAAEGERKAAQALKEASDVISESANALQLRFAYCISTNFENPGSHDLL